jgi:hypothetical protein
MFDISDFIRLLTVEKDLIHTHLEGLSQADTLHPPYPGGNCLNWVLGHMLNNQVGLLTLLGKAAPVDPAELQIYRGGSAPIEGTETGILPLERLLEMHDSVHAALVEAFMEVESARFLGPIQPGEDATLGWAVLYLNHHFSYHAGQLELLRQLAGKTADPL